MATTSLFRSRPVPAGATGLAVDLTPNKIGWQLIHFSVRHLAAGAVWDVETREGEVCLILLRGACRTYADSHQWDLGPRQDVFAGYPHAVYFPAGTRFRFVADTTCEIADGRAPARKRLEPRL